MNWIKKGRVFNVDKNFDWMYSHASMPFAEHMKDDVFKIYFSTRNSDNESSVAYIEVDIKRPNQILRISDRPLLSKGKLGTFDDSGTMGSCIVNIENKKYMYYIGWSLGVSVPFRNAIGLAVSENDGESFQRVFEGPIIDRTQYEPYFTASNCVLQDNGVFKTWYLSCTGWTKINGKSVHHYHIKYAESSNGIDWIREGVVAIDYKDKYEYAISAPRVIKEHGVYKMWFSSRGAKETGTYRIRYAESEDGIKWIRKDDSVGIDVGIQGWDSEMICYPFVFDHKGERYMLYNGNDYGKTGFGLAILETL